MAKDPAVLFYTQDFLVGVSLFSALQKGHYITLLCHQQQSETGSLTLEDIMTLMGRDFDRQWGIIKKKFKEDDKGYYNERMRKEISRRKQNSDKQKAKVDKRWDEVRKKNNTAAHTVVDTAVDTTVIPNNGNTFLETEIEIEKEKGVQGEKQDPLGSEFVNEIAHKVWKDQRWRESVCMGHRITEEDLKSWMAQFNTSVASDSIKNFSESSYKKMFNGWLNTQRSKGYELKKQSGNVDLTLKKI